MAYLQTSSFRSGSGLDEACYDIPLTTTEAPDAQLGSAIARFAQRFDDLTGDHFELEAVTLSLSGDETKRLDLPKRTVSVSSVSILDTLGNATAQTGGVYRLHSSLYGGGTKRLSKGETDYLELLWGAGGLTGYPANHYDPYTWPCDASSVQVTGNFGWTTTPADVKRAVALMVYDHFKPQDASLRRVQGYRTADAEYSMAQTQPTGIPEVDAIIDDFQYRIGDDPQVMIA